MTNESFPVGNPGDSPGAVSRMHAIGATCLERDELAKEQRSEVDEMSACYPGCPPALIESLVREENKDVLEEMLGKGTFEAETLICALEEYDPGTGRQYTLAGLAVYYKNEQSGTDQPHEEQELHIYSRLAGAVNAMAKSKTIVRILGYGSQESAVALKRANRRVENLAKELPEAAMQLSLQLLSQDDNQMRGATQHVLIGLSNLGISEAGTFLEDMGQRDMTGAAKLYDIRNLKKLSNRLSQEAEPGTEHADFTRSYSAMHDIIYYLVYAHRAKQEALPKTRQLFLDAAEGEIADAMQNGSVRDYTLGIFHEKLQTLRAENAQDLDPDS